MVLGLLVLNLLVGGGTLALHANDRAEAFSADDAVAEFRRAAPEEAGVATATTGVPADPDVAAAPVTSPQATSEVPSAPTTALAAGAPASEPVPSGPEASVPVPPFPAPGVYVYETTGYEAIDALGGSRHDYPASTTIVHRRDGCGATETWQPFEDRKDVRQLCGEPGRHRLEWFDATRAFFGRRDTRRLACDEGATAFVAGARPGDVHEFRCVDETETVAANRLEVLGLERIVVGGRPVDAVRTVATSQVSGPNSGSSRIESWVDARTGLTLRRTSVLDGRSPGPGGDVNYHEEYTLELTSLEPRT